MGGEEREAARDDLLRKRVEDAVRLSARKPYFLGFLDPRQCAQVRGRLRALRFENAMFWGGYEGAERVFAGFFPTRMPPDAAEFPVAALRVFWKAEGLTHRDVLGSLMGLGVERRAVGDILMRRDGCVLLLDAAMLPFVRQSLERVGSAPARCEPADTAGLRREQAFEPLEGTVASARLDSILAALTHVSRAQAAREVEQGRVQLNFEPCLKPARTVAPGAAVSARGAGRFDLLTLGPPTRKGRLRFTARRYL